MNKINQLDSIFTKKEKASLPALLAYFVFSLFSFIAIAWGVQYVYNDYAVLMGTGWQVVTLGQVYFTLVCISFVRLWFTHNQTIIAYTKNELTLSENALATFGKLMALGFALIFYTVIKAIVF